MPSEATEHKPTLDHIGDIGVDFQPSSDGYRLVLDYPNLPSRRLTRQFLKGLSVEIAGQSMVPDSNAIAARHHHHIEWHITGAPTANHVQIKLFGQPICKLQASKAGGPWQADPAAMYERLLMPEIKQMAQSDIPLKDMPYPRERLQGYDPQKHRPTTDTHTHLAAQVQPRELMRIAEAHDRRMEAPGITYPVELLQLLDTKGEIVTPELLEKAITVKPTKFSPSLPSIAPLDCEQDPKFEGNTCEAIRLQDLSPAARDLIIGQLTVAQTRVIPYGDFDEELYRYSNPIAKRPELARDTLMSIAEHYQQDGIRYGRISLSSMIKNPQWFADMIRTVGEAKKAYGVDLRFLAAIRRDSSPAEVLHELNKIKFILKHPYVTGIDIFGNESNGGDITWMLELVAQFVKNEGLEKDVVIRVHIGEIEKRPDDVVKCARIGKSFGVKVEAAHVITAKKMSTKSKGQLKEIANHNHFWAELCPLSNLTYNNVSSLDEVPIKELSGIVPYLYGSDGGGGLQITADQLALSALGSGQETLEGLVKLRHREENQVIHDMQGAESNKMRRYRASYPTDDLFIQAYEQHLKNLNAHSIDAEFQGRLPFLIMGSGGQSYNSAMPIHGEDLTATERAKSQKLRHTIAVAMEMLVLASNPGSNGFLLGRVKHEGVSGDVDSSLLEYQKDHNGDGFPVASITGVGTTQIAKAITYCEEIDGDASMIPKNIFGIATKLHPPALPIFIGGGDFTRSALLKYTDDTRFEGGYPRVIMENIPGASQEFARGAPCSTLCNDPISMLQAIDREVRSEKGKEFFKDVLLPLPETVYRRDANGEHVLDAEKLAMLQAKAEENVTTRERQQQATRSKQPLAKQ